MRAKMMMVLVVGLVRGGARGGAAGGARGGGQQRRRRFRQRWTHSAPTWAAPTTATRRARSPADGVRSTGTAAAPARAVTLDPSPMTRFSNRGAVFTTPGTGFEISGAAVAGVRRDQPDLSGAVRAVQQPAAVHRRSTATSWTCGSSCPAAPPCRPRSPGFGAVFTNVDVENSTRLEFYAPDGALLFERAVPWAAGNEIAVVPGRVVQRRRGRRPGADHQRQRGARARTKPARVDVAVMDDFIYGEPVSVQGLTLTPESGRCSGPAAFDLVVGVHGSQGVGWLAGACGWTAST